jgi:hypothetical protein
MQRDKGRISCTANRNKLFCPVVCDEQDSSFPLFPAEKTK